MGKRFTSVLAWLISLVNPPPLDTLSHLQKGARIVLFSATLIVTSILLSMLAAVGLFVMQHSWRLHKGYPQLLGAIGIILVSMIVNTVCVLVLLKIKNADQKIIPPPETPPAPKVSSKQTPFP